MPSNGNNIPATGNDLIKHTFSLGHIQNLAGFNPATPSDSRHIPAISFLTVRADFLFLAASKMNGSGRWTLYSIQNQILAL